MNLDEWNDEMQVLAGRWTIWRQGPFPKGWGGVAIGDCELVLIDADMAMLIESTVKRGPLKRGGIEELSDMLEELRRAMPSITGGAAAYFGELAAMAEVAIRLSRDACVH